MLTAQHERRELSHRKQMIRNKHDQYPRANNPRRIREPLSGGATGVDECRSGGKVAAAIEKACPTLRQVDVVGE